MNIWNYVIPIGSGLAVSTIILAVVGIIFKGIANRAIAKINTEKAINDAVDKAMERIKGVSFSQNIQPVLDSGLEKVNEKSIQLIIDSQKALDKKYDNIILCFEKFYAYFDNSIGVSDTKKEELKQAIINAKSPIVDTNETELIVDMTEEEKGIEMAKIDAKEKVNVER